MLHAIDINGTIDADPALFQHLMSALRAAGDQVAVLTGVHGSPTVTPADVQAKRARLAELAFTAYDQLVVFPDVGNLPALKADWCSQQGASTLIDNDRGNAEAAASECMVLVPWATRVGKKKDGER